MRTTTAEQKRAARLDDVAARAGVSATTVSRYFNNPNVVAKATAERIRTAVAELGYIPNLLAGGLALNRSRVVAVLVPHLTNSIFAETIESMVEELSREGTVVMLGVTADEHRLQELIQAALGRRVGAIILTGIVTDPAMRQQLRACNATVVETWGLPDDPIDVAVGFSHHAVGVEIARFLRTRGYRQLHVISADTRRAVERRDALLEEWRSGGGEPTMDHVSVPAHFGHARAAFANLRRLDAMPDVVVCGSDTLAQGIIIEARSSGLGVPGDLAVVGFGNSSLAGEMRPTITSVDVDGARIARETSEILRRRAAGEANDTHSIDVGFRLIARESA